MAATPNLSPNPSPSPSPNPNQALAATLPSIAKKAEAEVAVLLDTVLRAWTDGSLDADDLLPNDLPLKRVYALELACALPLPPPSQSLVNELSIDLSGVDRAVPQTSKEGVVTRLALDCHVDVRVTLAVPLQALIPTRTRTLALALAPTPTLALALAPTRRGCAAEPRCYPTRPRNCGARACAASCACGGTCRRA